MLNAQQPSGSSFFARTFGQNADNLNGASAQPEREPATIWMNIGYLVETGNEEQPTMFVSLPTGIAIDTMKPIEIKSRNQQFAAFQSARNDLLEQVKAAGAELKPGEERIIGGENGSLAIQLRHVNDPVVAPAADETNPFAKKLTLLG
jgi:hypothetical protein